MSSMAIRNLPKTSAERGEKKAILATRTPIPAPYHPRCAIYPRDVVFPNTSVIPPPSRHIPL
jgi:hypothetical protein